MLGIGHMPQIALLLLVALLIFGPKKLPELGSAFGRGIREFKDATGGTSIAEMPQIQQLPAAAPATARSQSPLPAVEGAYTTQHPRP